MFGSFGITELLIVILILVLLFGVNKLPKLGKGLGEGIRNFKSAFKEIGEDPEKKPQAEYTNISTLLFETPDSRAASALPPTA